MDLEAKTIKANKHDPWVMSANAQLSMSFRTRIYPYAGGESCLEMVLTHFAVQLFVSTIAHDNCFNSPRASEGSWVLTILKSFVWHGKFRANCFAQDMQWTNAQTTMHRAVDHESSQLPVFNFHSNLGRSCVSFFSTFGTSREHGTPT